MTAQLFRVIIQVSDIERAAAFYEKLLGMSGQRVSPGRHYFNCAGTILACFDPRADGDDFDAQANVDYIYIAVDDLDASYAAATEAGGAAGQESAEPPASIAAESPANDSPAGTNDLASAAAPAPACRSRSPARSEGGSRAAPPTRRPV